MGNDATPTNLPVRLDPVCDRFEAAWLSDGRPLLEDFLPLVAEADRAALLRELLALELEYRVRRGEAPTAEEYRLRLPDHAALIDEAFVSPTVRPEATPAAAHSRPRRSSPTPPAPVPGYEVLGVLGQGGMGVVYKARQLSLNRTVALKMILDAAGAEPEELARFRTEAEALASLRHPHIVQIHEVGEVEGRPYFALEFLEGGSLAAKLDGTPRPPAEAARLVETLARAVHAAHEQKVVHRDLKPANVLLTADGTPKVTDFGLAKRLDAGEGLSRTGQVMGTPSYMPPEQALGRTREVGPAADVYSLGVILYELLTGRVPFRGASGLETLQQVVAEEPVPPRRLQPRTPRDVETVCLKCLEKKTGRRYATALELAEELRRFQAGEPVRARPCGPLERGWKWARRKPAKAVAIALLTAILVLGGGGGGVVWLWLRAEAARTNEEAAKKQAQDADAKAEGLLKQFQEAQKQHLRADYLDHIHYAQLEWNDGRMEEARKCLEDSDHDSRSWEWYYLKGAYQGASIVIPDSTGAAFSPDGRRIIAAGRDGTASIWDLASGEAIPGFHAHDGAVADVALSPDGGRIATMGDDGTVRLWDAASREQTALLRGPPGRLRTMRFLTGGCRVVSAEDDGTVWLWGRDPGTEAVALRGNAAKVWRLAVSPDGGRIAAACWDGTVRIWDAASAGELAAFSVGKATILDMAFNGDGSRLATAGNDGSVRIWNANTGEAAASPRGHDEPVGCVVFSPDGRRVATSSWDSTVRLWDAASGASLAELRGHSGPVYGLAFSPDGGRLASAGDDGTVRVWRLLEGETEGSILRGHTGPVSRVAFSPDGGWLCSTGQDKTVRVWNAASAKDRAVLRGPRTTGPPQLPGVRGVAYSPDGCVVAGAGVDGTVRLWDAASGALLRPVLQGDGAAFNAVAFSPVGGRLAAAGDDGAVRLWEPATGRLLAVLPVGVCGLTDVAFSRDGGCMAAASRDGSVVLWDAGGAPTFTLHGHTGAVNGVAFNRAGDRLASAGHDGTVRLWDVGSGKEVEKLSEHEGSVTGVAFNRAGDRLASAGLDGTIRLWVPGSGQPAAVLHGPKAQVNGVAFNRDGDRLASAGPDGTVRLWDVESGKEVMALRRHNGMVSRVAFSPDGRRLASAGLDDHVVEWITLERPEDWEERRRVWREGQAAEAEETRQWFAAAFHLSRLIDNSRPDDLSLLYLRRSWAYALQAHWGLAGADLIRAADLNASAGQ